MININYNNKIKKIHNFWNNILFHPTDAIEDDWGKQILDTIAEDNVAETVRIYAMLEDIVSCDENGKLHYDFTLNDMRIDYLISKGFKLFITYAFLPPFCVENSDLQSSVSKNKTRYKGKMIYTGMPKDNLMFEEICYQYTKHITKKYGEELVSEWYMQCYNEPDLSLFFLGEYADDEDGRAVRLREYIKLYKQFAKGVKRVSEKYRIGQSIADAEHKDFFDGFLMTTKQENIPIDFVALHTYGTSPELLISGKRMFNEHNTIDKHIEYLNVINKYYSDIDIIVDEWGASNYGYYDIDECPNFIFREDSRYAAYFGKMIKAYIDENIPVKKMMICLSGQHEMKKDFTGFRGFFTLNFFKKPLYNAYILGSKLKNVLVESETDNENLSVLATTDGANCGIMLSYASETYEKELDSVNDKINIKGLNGNYHVVIYCIDEMNTNPFNLYKRNGYDQSKFTEHQLEILRNEGILKPIKEYNVTANNELIIDDVSFTNNALFFVEIKKEI